MPRSESVLVLPLPLPSTTESLLTRSDYFFRHRIEAERDNTAKQLIPYIVICDGKRLLAYRRHSTANEVRLTGLLSIGWGGHIEPVDESPSDIDRNLETTISNCAMSEIREELSLGAPVYRRRLGLVYSDQTEVDSHHLGWVELWVYPDGLRKVTDADEAFWLDPSGSDLELNNFESWSQVAINRVRLVLRSG